MPAIIGFETPAYSGNVHQYVTSVLRPSEFEWNDESIYMHI